MGDFKDLKVWERAHELTLSVHKATGKFPKAEEYGLTSQLRRSSVSVAAKIAEGCGRGSDAECARYLRIAMGSVYELEYHLILARDLGFLEAGEFEPVRNLVGEVGRMLNAFINKLAAGG